MKAALIPIILVQAIFTIRASWPCATQTHTEPPPAPAQPRTPQSPMPRSLQPISSTITQTRAGAIVVPASSTQSLGAVTASPSIIPINTPTPLATTSRITAPPSKTSASLRPQIGAPLAGTLTASPTLIPANSLTPVTFTLQVIDSTLIQNSINLLQIGASGTQPMILGVMQGNGGGTYFMQVVFKNAPIGQVQLQASAAFRGLLQRVSTNVVTVNVGNTITDQTGRFTVLYPPSLYNLTDSTTPPGDYDLESSPAGVAIGGAAPEDSAVASSGFAISIYNSAYTPSGTFDINQYLFNTFGPLAGDATSTPVSIGGVPGYEITFQNEEAGNQPLAVLYNNGYVYQIKYSSTDYILGFSDQEGLNAFAAILQNISFSQ